MNVSVLDPAGLSSAPSWSPFGVALRTSIIAFLGVVSVAGNSFCIAVTLHVTIAADSTKVLLVTRAVYDLLVGVLVLCMAVVSALDEWPFGLLGCQLFTVIVLAIFLMSVSSVVFLNVERYIAITRPYKFPVWCSRRRTTTLVLVASAVSLCMAVLMLVAAGISVQYYPPSGCCFFAVDKFADTFNLLLADLVPVVTMICVYRRLIRISRRHMERVTRHEANASGHEDKALRSFLVVTISYGVCYTPFLMTRILESYAGSIIPPWFMLFTVVFVYCNSTLNVFIYCLFNHSYRQTAKKIALRMLRYSAHQIVPLNT